jgi:hypothetical protein
MNRLYIGKTWYPKGVPVEQHRMQVQFESKAQNADYYETELAAENDCVSIFRRGIAVVSSDGARHILENFKVEQIALHEFVIFCDVPFPLLGATA